MWKAYPFLNQRDTRQKPLIGISACLCGDSVRYDGRSKWQPELIKSLEKSLKLEKLCPEVAIGMGVPRPPIQLTCDNGKIEAVGVANPDQNFTAPLRNYANSIISRQQAEGEVKPLCGYLFKSRSPSCGVGSTPLHLQGKEVNLGSGIVAHQLKQKLPWLPILEEDDLCNTFNLKRFVFLVFLTDDLLNSKGLLNHFHAHHAKLIQRLPGLCQSTLHELANQPSAELDYLTTLNKALFSLKPDDF